MNSIGKLSKRVFKSVYRSHQLHVSATLNGSRFYPINDDVFGLNEDQKQLRQSVFNFCQAELAPYANEIDKNNGWAENRVCNRRRIDYKGSYM